MHIITYNVKTRDPIGSKNVWKIFKWMSFILTQGTLTPLGLSNSPVLVCTNENLADMYIDVDCSFQPPVGRPEPFCFWFWIWIVLLECFFRWFVANDLSYSFWTYFYDYPFEGPILRKGPHLCFKAWNRIILLKINWLIACTKIVIWAVKRSR